MRVFVYKFTSSIVSYEDVVIIEECNKEYSFTIDTDNMRSYKRISKSIVKKLEITND